MRRLSLRRALWSQEGVALPVTLFVLLLFASLTAAFAVLSATEPQIAANLRQGGEVLGLAEAGVEETIWALDNPTAAGWAGFPTTASPARYDGSTWLAFATGGYKITVTPGPGANEFTVTSDARIPNNATPTAQKRVTVTLWSLNGRINPPAALSVNGQLQVGGNSVIDGSLSTCGTKVGTQTLQSTTISGSGKIYGGDGNTTPNQSTDYAQNQPLSSFNALTQQELNTLKALAQANGTYYQGNQSFSSIPNGVVFVDTVSGNPIGTPPNASDLASATITGGNGSGWLIVMGSVTINGNVGYTGLVYAANDLVYRGTGSGTGIKGGIMSLNVVDTISTAIDSDTSGNARITYDCNAINTGVATGGTGSPTVPQGYFVKPGTWRQVSG